MRWLRIARSVAVLAGAAGLNAACAYAGGCAPTPAAAVEMAVAPMRSPGTLSGPEQGYRVKAVRWDSLQRQSWAVIERCEHPELPAVAVLTKLREPVAVTGSAREGSPLAAASVSPSPTGGETVSAAVIRANAAVAAVKAGDVVRLWKADERAHIELIGTAEENGVVGARVRVRLTEPKEADGTAAPPQFLAGVVRGPADVEMER